MQLVWLAQSPTRKRVQVDHARHDVPPAAIFTPDIMRALPSLIESTDPAVCDQRTSVMEQHVFALGLVEAGAPTSVMDSLTHEEQTIQDFGRAHFYTAFGLMIFWIRTVGSWSL